MKLSCFLRLLSLIGHLIFCSKLVTDTSLKWRLQCGVQFSWCTLALRNQTITKIGLLLLVSEKDGMWQHIPFLKTTMIVILFQDLNELDYGFLLYRIFNLVIIELGPTTRLQASAHNTPI